MPNMINSLTTGRIAGTERNTQQECRSSTLESPSLPTQMQIRAALSADGIMPEESFGKIVQSMHATYLRPIEPLPFLELAICDCHRASRIGFGDN